LFPSDDPKEVAQYTISEINHCMAFVIVSTAIVPDFDTLDNVDQFPGFASDVSDASISKTNPLSLLAIDAANSRNCIVAIVARFHNIYQHKPRWQRERRLDVR
jgi:hypothetical protein